ncbi:MAG: hypothetical protein OXB86_05190 [Bdellovibrionales bacterium]|nr:hypothetical protein [Bdellovibrionales bacterium]
MKWLISCFVFFSSFGIYSPVAFTEEESLHEMRFNHFIAAYKNGRTVSERVKDGIDESTLKKAYGMVDGEGNNILYHLILLERSENFRSGSDLETLLIKEAEFIFNAVGPERFIRLLRQKNHEGFSPLEIALASKQFIRLLRWRNHAAFLTLEKMALASKQFEGEIKSWEKVLSPYILVQPIDSLVSFLVLESTPLSREDIELLGSSVPAQNRGVAYSALRHVVKSYNWSWRAIIARLPWGAVPAVAGGGIATVGSSEAELYVGAAVALSGMAGCAWAFKEWYNAGRVSRALSRF